MDETVSRIKLTEETVRCLWSQTYNTNGKPDWSHLFPYYYDNMYFYA
mgnify:CR=1 FL=1